MKNPSVILPRTKKPARAKPLTGRFCLGFSEREKGFEICLPNPLKPNPRISLQVASQDLSSRALSGRLRTIQGRFTTPWSMRIGIVSNASNGSPRSTARRAQRWLRPARWRPRTLTMTSPRRPRWRTSPSSLEVPSGERVRQIEEQALENLKQNIVLKRLHDELAE